VKVSHAPIAARDVVLNDPPGGSGGGTMFTGGYDASSLIQYNRRASGICGAILAPVAIIFMIYALLTYMW